MNELKSLQNSVIFFLPNVSSIFNFLAFTDYFIAYCQDLYKEIKEGLCLYVSVLFCFALHSEYPIWDAKATENKYKYHKYSRHDVFRATITCKIKALSSTKSG